MTDAPLPIIACPRTHERAAELFDRWPRGRALELAAGSGAFAQRLQRMGFEVEACDLYPEDFRAAGIPVQRVDLSESLPWPDASFQYLSCLESIEHLEDQFAFIRECWRVLEPGGRLLITTPNVLNLAGRRRYRWTGFFPLATRPMNEFRRMPVHDHIHLITYYGLRYILHTTGFRIEEVTTDRWRRTALGLLWTWPGVWLSTHMALAREPDPQQREANREIARHMLSPALLFGRTLVVTARKPR